MNRIRILFAGVAALVLGVSGEIRDETLSLHASIGYGIGIGGLLIDSSETYTSGRLVDQQDHYQNLGKGIKIEAGGTYSLMDGIGLMAGLEYSAGAPAVRVEGTGVSVGAVTGSIEKTYESSQLGLKALVAPRFRVLDLMEMYVGVGAGLYLTFSSLDVRFQPTGAGEFSAAVKQSNRPSLAFLANTGADIPLSDYLFLFGEIGFAAMSVTQTEWEVTDSDFPTNNPFAQGPNPFEKDAIDRPAPPKIPASTFVFRIGARFAVL